MKPVFFVGCLAALLSAGPVHSLTCFSCDRQSSNLQCLGMTQCSSSDKYCVTTYFGGSYGGESTQSISKGCAPVCPQGGIDIGIVAASVRCCESFLCNISGASSVKTSYAVMAVGILTSFLYILRSGL
uniref:Lymphocyte antigen 6 family member E n=1 Tax=Sphenodon punctatus TaxID=8508 RepID=A0A8D0GG70_SPHPU